MEIAEKLFKLKENNTDIKTELTAGLTTFFTMSYLLLISPKLLEYSGMDLSASVTVTAFITFIGCLLMGFISNKPYAVAPFLGETAFIAYTVVGVLGYSVKMALTAIFICGIILFIMTLTNIRTYILEKIPNNIKISFCTGLGLFFIYISLKDIGIVKFTTDNIPVSIGNLSTVPVILGILCFLSIVILTKRGINSAILISVLATTLLGILSGNAELPKNILSVPAGISSSLLQFDFSHIFTKNFATVFFVLFLLVNIDTSGSIIGLGLNSQSNKNSEKKAMIADSLSVILAPILGTTTTGAYFDSITGMQAGGKTGLTAICTGFLFLLSLLLTPLILVIPAYAYAPALLYVGILMTTSIVKIDFSDVSEYAVSIFTIAVMIFTYNIGLGIISAFITYPLIKLLCGKKQETNVIMWIMFVVSIVFFIIYPY